MRRFVTSLFRRAIHKIRRGLQTGRKLVLAVREFRQLGAVPAPRFALRWSDRWLHLRDATRTTAFDRHYVYHTAWAARVLARTRPERHVDVASSLYFVTSISAFIPVTFIDFRPAALGLPEIASGEGTLLALPFDSGSVESLSCMHVLEHVGLGRYGDPLDYDGDLKAVAELYRVLAPGGRLLLVVPVGGEARIQFNAHRIYTHAQVVAMNAQAILEEFSLIPDDGFDEGLIRDAQASQADEQRYGCGCFLFRKPSP